MTLNSFMTDPVGKTFYEHEKNELEYNEGPGLVHIYCNFNFRFNYWGHNLVGLGLSLANET